MESTSAQEKQFHADDALAAQAVAHTAPGNPRGPNFIQSRVGAQNMFNTQLGKIEKAKTDADDKYKLVLLPYKAGEDDDDDESETKSLLSEAKEELDNAMKVCQLHFQSLKGCIDSKVSDVNVARNIDALVLLRKQAVEDMKQLFAADAFKKFTKIAASFKKNLEDAKKNAAPLASSASVTAAIVNAAPALFGNLAAAIRAKPSVSVSLFEAKAGMRIAVVKYDASTRQGASTRRAAVQVPLIGTPLCKKVEKGFAKALKTQEYVLYKPDPNEAKKLEKSLRGTLDAAYFPQHTVPETTWGQNFIKKEFFAGKPPSFSIGYTPYCCIDVRIVLKGCICIAGVPYDVAPGENLKMKREALFHASAEQWTEFIGKGGWITQVMAGEAMAVPTGFIVTMAYPDYSFGVRWCIRADEADDMRVLRSLQQLSKDFPETKSTQSGYPQFIEFLSGGQ